MSFTNGQYGDDSYLVYQLEMDDVVETMSFGQITNNLIEGLAPATFTQMDTTRSVMYKITSHMPLEDFLQRSIKKKHLIKLLSGIVGAIRNAQEYMIDPSMFLLDKKFVFVKTSPFAVSLICLPVQQSPYRRIGLQEFLWNLVVKARTDSSENREYIAVLNEKLDPEMPMSMEEIEKLLEAISQDGGYVEPAAANASTPAANTYRPPQPVYTPPQPIHEPPKKTSRVSDPVPSMPPQPPVPPVTPKPVDTQPESYGWEVGLKDNFGDEARDQGKKSGGLFGFGRAPKEKPVKEEKPKKEPEKKVNRKEPHHFDLISSDRPVAIFDEPEEPVQKPYEAPASVPNIPFDVPGSQSRTPAYEPPVSQSRGGFDVPGSQSRGGFDVPGSQSRGGFDVPGSQGRTPAYEPPVNQSRTPAFEVPGGSGSSSSSGRMAFDIPGSNGPDPDPRLQKNKWFGGHKETPKTQGPAVLNNITANNYSGTVYVSAGDDSGGTIWENPTPEAPTEMNARLFRENGGENVPISGIVFQIGSDYDYSDYHIGNNRSVSGTHAQILVRQNAYFIKDMNSRNHTYVDDRMIPSGVETPLYHGSRVRLGSERFIFYLY